MKLILAFPQETTSLPPSAYEKGLPGLPGKSLGVGLKMVSDSKPVGESEVK